MTNRDHKPVQKQQITPKIAALPKSRSFSSEISQGETEVAPKLEINAHPFHFNNLTVGTVEPASSPNLTQNLVPG